MIMGIAAYEELGITELPIDRCQRQPEPEPSDALIISDLHLGSENCQAKPLAAFLQLILDGHLPTRRLIINGDVFDSIDFRRLKKTHWKVLSLIRHLSDKIDITWIAGNHDGSADIISHLLGVHVEEHCIITSGNRKFLVIHGHQWDDFINDHPFLTSLADAAYWCLQKIDRTHHVARLAKRRSKTFIRCISKIRTGALQHAARLNCHAAICGHTHHAAHELFAAESHAPAYFNSGCWTESPATYLQLSGGEIELRQFAAEGAMLVAGAA